MMPPDEDLLNAFVKSHDEQAFRGLAERYSGLIFHTALRSLNDRTLAEDVAQRVLCVLAKKASSVTSGNSPLPAWLHRTTILEAKSVRRSESRHHRKKEALMRAPADSPDSSNTAWKDALPHLDAAIDTLPDADRHIILLHFVSEMTFPEIATRVGKSAAAVQKQSRRALETLQRILGRRGVTLSLGILTAGLTSEMVKAGPVLLVPVLSSLGKTSTSILVVKKSTLAAIGTTILLCGIPLARQQVTTSRLESKLSAASGSPPEARISSRPGNAKSLSMAERLSRDLKSQDRDVPRYLGAVDYIEGLSDEDLIALIKEAVASSMPFPNQEIVFGKLFDTLANREPGFALDTLLTAVPAEHIGKSRAAENLLPNCLRNLSEKDPQKALAWFRNHLPAIRSIPIQGRFPKDELENRMRTELAYGLLTSSPAGSLEILNPLSKENLQRAFETLAEERQPFPTEKLAGYVKAARELLPEEEAGKVMALLVGRRIDVGKGAMPYQSVDALLATESFSPSEFTEIARHAGARRMDKHHEGLEAGILQYKAWLEEHQAVGMDRTVGETLGQMMLSWESKAEPVYQAMLNREALALGDEAVAGLLATAGHKLDPERVAGLADSLADQDLAAELILQINKRRTP